MFYYFGRKSMLAKHYPEPRYDTIIEPFAGSMAFSFYWKPEHAIGFEADKNVVEAWNWITDEEQTPESILSIPFPEIGEIVTNRWTMMSAVSERGWSASYYRWTNRMNQGLKNQKNFAAKNLDYARNHVEYVFDSYKNAPDIEATWFIDPPYQNLAVKKKGYTNVDIDFSEIADFCLSRRGQVIVCEQEGALWLPFKPLKEITGVNGKKTMEVVWYNEM